MADFASLPFRYRIEMAMYPWRRLERTPWQPLRVPLHDARVALVTSGGVYRSDVDHAFQRERGGDVSFRVIPSGTAPSELIVGQTSQAFDHAPAERDPNVVFPIDRLREFAGDGAIGSVAPRHLSFNGSITAPGRLVKHTAPEAARMLQADAVDAALFVPV